MKFDLAIKKPKLGTIKVSELKYMLLLIFCFFPYLNILHLPTDTQPNALIVSIFILLTTHRKKMPAYYFLFIILFYVAFIMLLLSNFELGAILSFSNYTSVMIVPLAVFYTLKRYNGLSYTFFKNVVLIWGAVGVIQKFVYSRFLVFLLSRSSGIASLIDGRGVVGLAPEPTYFGSMVVLFLIVYCLFFAEKKDYKILLVMFIELFFLSKSSTSILVLGISAMIFGVLELLRSPVRRIILTMVYSIPASMLLIVGLPILFEGTRAKNIFLVVISNPKLIFFDTSITERFNAAYFSTLSLFEHIGVPQGFGTYQAYIYQKSTEKAYQYLFLGYRASGYNRILSGFGMGFFELGAFGLLIPLFIFIAIRKHLKKARVLFAYVVFNLLLMTAMSLNNALILFIFGLLIYLSSQHKEVGLAESHLVSADNK